MKPAFIFDLDGVITDTATLHFQAWKKTVAQIGIHLDQHMNTYLKGLSRMDSLQFILEHCGMQGRFSAQEKTAIANSKNELYKESISTLTPEHILPGMEGLLEHIRKHRHPIALASASHNAPLIIQALQLEDLFHTIANPTNIQEGKPAPDIFLLAAKMLHVPPLDCIGIEDAKSGVDAIKAAQMFAIGIGDTTILQKADYIVDSTEQLHYPIILEKWQQRKGY